MLFKTLLLIECFHIHISLDLDHPAMKTGDLKAVLEGKGKLSVRITKKRTSVLNSQGSYLWPKMQFWSS